MGNLGAGNSLPLELGGDDTLAERIYEELRKAVGGNGAGGGGAGPRWDEDPTSLAGVEDWWRWCKAEAIAAVLDADERAVLQFFPEWATDLIGTYEEALGVAEEDTLAGREAAITAAWTLALAADIPTIRSELAALDPAADVIFVSYAQATLVMFGKNFGPRTGGPPYGSGLTTGVNASRWPNFASDFVLHVKYTLPSGVLSVPEQARAAIARYLNERLPSFVDWTISTGTPFYLDGGPDGTSLLDQTAFD
jgi:hypothetical protein